MVRFDAQEYVDTYRASGRFPAIHNDIMTLLHNYAALKGAIMDLGACTGLLSIQMAQKLKTNVVAVEGNPKSIARALKRPDVLYRQLNINGMEAISTLHGWLSEYHIRTVVARRVLPEIAQTVGDAVVVRQLAYTCWLNGVYEIAVEGRQATKSAVAILPSLEAEIEALASHYTEYKRYKNCVLMRIKS